MTEHAFQAGIEQLRDGFLTRIAQRLMAIDAIVEGAGPGPVSHSDRRQIAHHAHKTAGVAATFGFEDLGGSAGLVERLMTSTDGDLDWTDARPAVEDLLDQMERALDGEV